MKVCLCGCNGRMGRMLIAHILETEACLLTGGVEHYSSPAIGQDIATLVGRSPIGHLVGQEAVSLFHTADVILDFSSPSATVAHAAAAAMTGKALVVGTTGLDSEQFAALVNAAHHVPVLYSPNMSLSVNLLFFLVEQVSRVLDASYDIEILEMHHRAKVDAPSGTALELGQAAARGRGIELSQSSQRIRDGYVGQRQKGHIGFATVRGGDLIGEHTVLFMANGERIELTHKVNARNAFARGAIQAASWLWNRQSGMYSMRDVFEQRESSNKVIT